MQCLHLPFQAQPLPAKFRQIRMFSVQIIQHPQYNVRLSATTLVSKVLVAHCSVHPHHPLPLGRGIQCFCQYIVTVIAWATWCEVEQVRHGLASLKSGSQCAGTDAVRVPSNGHVQAARSTREGSANPTQVCCGISKALRSCLLSNGPHRGLQRHSIAPQIQPRK